MVNGVQVCVSLCKDGVWSMEYGVWSMERKYAL